MSPAFVAVFVGLVAASFASFAAATGARLATGEGINGRSHCVCGRTLTSAELVPVLSWLRCGGKARCCGSRIPVSLVVGESLALVVPVAAVALGGVAVGVAAAVVVVVAVGVHAWVVAKGAASGPT